VSARAVREREATQLARRFEVLYRDLEIEPRALEALAELGDPNLVLRGEEAIKRLAEDPENTAV
jgi:hypothetical protein